MSNNTLFHRKNRLSFDSMLSFDGVDQYVDLPLKPEYLTNVFTLSCFFQINEQPSSGKPLIDFGGGNYRNLQISANGTRLRLITRNFTSGGGQSSAVTTNIYDFPIGRIFHFAFSFDVNKVYVYVNGKLEYINEDYHYIPMDGTTFDSVYINGSLSSGTASHNILCNHFSFFNRNLTESEIRSIQQLGGVLPESVHASCVAHYVAQAGAGKFWDVVEQYNYTKELLNKIESETLADFSTNTYVSYDAGNDTLTFSRSDGNNATSTLDYSKIEEYRKNNQYRIEVTIEDYVSGELEIRGGSRTGGTVSNPNNGINNAGFTATFYILQGSLDLQLIGKGANVDFKVTKVEVIPRTQPKLFPYHGQFMNFTPDELGLTNFSGQTVWKDLYTKKLPKNHATVFNFIKGDDLPCRFAKVEDDPVLYPVDSDKIYFMVVVKGTKSAIQHEAYGGRDAICCFSDGQGYHTNAHRIDFYLRKASDAYRFFIELKVLDKSGGTANLKSIFTNNNFNYSSIHEIACEFVPSGDISEWKIWVNGKNEAVTIGYSDTISSPLSFDSGYGLNIGALFYKNDYLNNPNHVNNGAALSDLAFFEFEYKKNDVLICDLAFHGKNISDHSGNDLSVKYLEFLEQPGVPQVIEKQSLFPPLQNALSGGGSVYVISVGNAYQKTPATQTREFTVVQAIYFPQGDYSGLTTYRHAKNTGPTRDYHNVGFELDAGIQKIYFDGANPGSSNRYNEFQIPVISPGWHSLAVQYIPNDKSVFYTDVKVYIDGVLLLSETDSLYKYFYSNNSEFNFQIKRSGFTVGYTCIFERLLSRAEIIKMSNNTLFALPENQTDLAGFWNFNEIIDDTGTYKILEQSGNGNDAVLTNYTANDVAYSLKEIEVLRQPETIHFGKALRLQRADNEYIKADGSLYTGRHWQFWFFPLAQEDQSLIRHTLGGIDYCIALRADGQMEIFANHTASGGKSQEQQTYNIPWKVGQWNFIHMSLRQSQPYYIRLFVNGVSYNCHDVRWGGGESQFIGRSYSTYQNFDGFIAKLSWNGAQNSDSITEDLLKEYHGYALYDYTPYNPSYGNTYRLPDDSEDIPNSLEIYPGFTYVTNKVSPAREDIIFWKGRKLVSYE